MASLYIGNLYSDVTEVMVIENFSTAGAILSVHVITRRLLGYPYVNFQNMVDAQRALDTNMRMQSIGPIYQRGASSGYFVPTILQPQHFYGPTQMTQIRPQPRWASQPQVRAGTPQATAADYPNMATQYRNIGVRAPVPAGHQAALARNAMVDRNAKPITTAQQQMPGDVAAGGVCIPIARGSGFGYKYTANMRNSPDQAQGMGQVQPDQPPAPVQAAIHAHGQEPLTETILATAKPEDQKQILGQRLFPLIQGMYPELSDKITCMLLEINNSDLLHMLEHQESLKIKIEEAVTVLQAHQAQQTQMKKE
eukprot:XP_001945427.1 PREDICTED: polyadenylate-binding protein 1-like [Acyrthosiphon pisum]